MLMRALPRLGPIESRIMDIIVTLNGRFAYYSGLGEALLDTRVGKPTCLQKIHHTRRVGLVKRKWI